MKTWSLVKAGRVVWKEMGLDICETLIYQIFLEVSITAAPKTPKWCLKLFTPHQSASDFYQDMNPSQPPVAWKEMGGNGYLKYCTLMEKFHKENH